MAAFQRDSIREVYKKKYPHIFNNINTTKFNRGLQRFITDELIDLNIFEDTLTATHQVTGAEMEDIDLKILKDTSTTTSPTEDETIPLREPKSSGPSQPTSSRNLDQYLGIEESKLFPSAHEEC